MAFARQEKKGTPCQWSPNLAAFKNHLEHFLKNPVPRSHPVLIKSQCLGLGARQFSKVPRGSQCAET